MKNKTYLYVLIVMLVWLSSPVETAQKKPQGQKKPHALKKMMADIVPRDRVMRDFGSSYSPPPDTKTIRTRYAAAIQRGKEKRGESEVPTQTHRVEVLAELVECGMRLRNTFTVRYYRLETDWIFEGISPLDSKVAALPKKKPPIPDEPSMRRCVSEMVSKNHPQLEVQSITILRNKGSWNLCVPSYKVTAKIEAITRDEVYHTYDRYECLYVTIMEWRGGSWSPVNGACVYRGNEIAECHIGTMCRHLSTEQTIPSLSDETATSLLKSAFEAEYFNRKNNITVEEFQIVTRSPAEVFGTKVPFRHRALYVIDEKKERFARGASDVKTYDLVRAVYECSVCGHCRYDSNEKKWKAFIDSCGTTAENACGSSCSVPSQACRRLGEK